MIIIIIIFFSLCNIVVVSTNIQTEWISNGADLFPLTNHASCLTPDKREIVVFGGVTFPSVIGNFLTLYNVDSNGWKNLTTSGQIPLGVKKHSILCLPDWTVLLFGGSTSDGKYVNSLYSLDLKALVWTKLVPKGNIPASRNSFGFHLDNQQLNVILFGGQGSSGFYQDTWLLNLETLYWSQLTTSGDIPSKRSSFASLVTPENELYVFGGIEFHRAEGYVGDLYKLHLGSKKWTKIPLEGYPPERRGLSSAVYVEEDFSILLFGGYDWDGNYRNDVRQLSLSDNYWHELYPTGQLPAPRSAHTAVLVNDVVHFIGGYCDQIPYQYVDWIRKDLPRLRLTWISENITNHQLYHNKD